LSVHPRLRGSRAPRRIVLAAGLALLAVAIPSGAAGVALKPFPGITFGDAETRHVVITTRAYRLTLDKRNGRILDLVDKRLELTSCRANELPVGRSRTSPFAQGVFLHATAPAASPIGGIRRRDAQLSTGIPSSGLPSPRSVPARSSLICVWRSRTAVQC
jgi:hypothetical protein